MAMDFCALLKSQFPRLLSNVSTLVEQGSPDGVRYVADHWKNAGFAEVSLVKPVWVPRYSVEPGVVQAPSLPDLQLALRTKEEFYLTFGIDALSIYHPLRWHTFLVEQEWQLTMLDACNAFADLFDATEAILTNDESPVIETFYQGASFDDALAAGKYKNGEVGHLHELLEIVDSDGTWDSHGFYRFRTSADSTLPKRHNSD